MTETTPPASFRAHHCIDCGTPISPYSRGRCRSCGYKGLKREVPDDFAKVVRVMGSQGAARHYHTSLSTVTRWRREMGMVKHERAKRPSFSGGGTFRTRGFVERPLMTNRDFTLAGQAAEFLRHYGSVYRCDASGKPNAKGTHWKRNFSILTDDQIVSRAKRLGFEPFDV